MYVKFLFQIGSIRRMPELTGTAYWLLFLFQIGSIRSPTPIP